MLTKTKENIKNLIIQPWVKIITGLVLGVVVGLIFGEKALVLKPIGNLFINSIMMMVPIVVFVSIVCGVVSISDPLKMGRFASKSLAIYIMTMAIGSFIALFMSTVVFQPGVELSIDSLNLTNNKEYLNNTSSTTFTLSNLLVGIIPSNIMTSFMEGNLLQIITFAILTGIAINLTRESSKPLIKILNSISTLVFKIIEIVMKSAPLGVFALMAIVAGTQGINVILSLLSVVLIAYLSMFMLFIVYGVVLSFAGLNPFTFYKKMFEAQLVAFSTASSVAALPINLKNTEHSLGVKKSITNFVLPLGATVNMNGLASTIGVIAIFAANLYGIQLSIGDMITITITSVIAAIGAAGVPAAGIVVLPMVLGSVGIPLDVIGLIVAINRILDMMSTTTNITGDTFAAVLVAKSENELDTCIYNNQEQESFHPITIPEPKKV